MPQTNRETRRWQDAVSGLGPLDEGDRVLEIRLEITPFGR